MPNVEVATKTLKWIQSKTISLIYTYDIPLTITTLWYNGSKLSQTANTTSVQQTRQPCLSHCMAGLNNNANITHAPKWEIPQSGERPHGHWSCSVAQFVRNRRSNKCNKFPKSTQTRKHSQRHKHMEEENTRVHMYMGFCAHRYAQLYGTSKIGRQIPVKIPLRKYSHFQWPVTKFILTMATKLIALLYMVALNKIKFVTIFEDNILKVRPNQHHAESITISTARIKVTNLEMSKFSLFIINATQQLKQPFLA